jgi:hypothetical protein
MDGKCCLVVVVVFVRFCFFFVFYTLTHNNTPMYVSFFFDIQTCHVGSIWTYLTGMYESYGWC